jgi:DNA-directed RNA polymerase specialized sigma24 family protein
VLHSEEELFDLLAKAADPPASANLEAQAEVEELLSLASDEDQRVIRLAILQDLSGEELARELGKSPGAARVQLSRALGRLRDAHRRRASEGLE